MNFAQLGNDLYTGKRSTDFVGRYKTWYVASLVLFLLALAGLGLRGLNLGIEFTGGSDFRVANVASLDNFEQRARTVVASAGGVEGARVTQVAGTDVRVETERFDADKVSAVSAALSKEFGVPATSVTSSVIGPSWGASVSKQALQALAWFLVLVSIVLAVYFRTWKMSLSAIVALLHDIFITVGIYALAGFEVSPATMIGFLTILGYSLYDTVVVFDKVRENTTEALASGRSTYSDAANLAVNQTLVRSINTTVVALLPVGAILVVGLVFIGPGTLLDLSLALFVGIAVGAYSSIFIATPLLAHLREREPEMRKLAARVAQRDAKAASRAQREAPTPIERGDAEPGTGEPGSAGARVPATGQGSGDDAPAPEGDAGERTLTGRPIHPSIQTGPRNQPRRLPKAKR
ncbi:MAG: protein translocase subunit SecF [Dermatophilaceae bacterium]